MPRKALPRKPMPRKPRERRPDSMTLPVLPLRGLVIYPHVTVHFDVGRSMSVAALEQAMMADQRLLLVAQRDAEQDEPAVDDLYTVGTVAVVKQMMNLPGEIVRVLVEGECRGTIERVALLKPAITAAVRTIQDSPLPKDTETQALIHTLRDSFEQYAQAGQRVSPEVVTAILENEDAGAMTDLIASNILDTVESRQELLEIIEPAARMERLCIRLAEAVELIDAEKQVQARVKKQVEKNQKDYYLREQIRAIQSELGEGEFEDVEELRARVEAAPLNEEAKAKCFKELNRLASMSPGNPEALVARTYVEWILDLPWGKSTPDNLDLNRARKVLAEDHYGLVKVKERIIEYLAVLQMKQDMKGPILCFVGPPGVGKTSIVRAIAQAVGREFVRMSLGGVRDEAEIRGHRRTYIGAIPGRIIAGLKQAGTMNPVFLFDEIDKMSGDFRGDPASALLEVLDAEQNNAFRDHYLELPFDLSKVMFITTANSVETIPGPLLDRMEVIEVPSYTEEEKLQIAKQHLLRKQLKEHGLSAGSVRIADKVMRELIEGWTREAGVRQLERTIGQVVRKSVVTMLETGVKRINVTSALLRKDLGAPRYLRELPLKEPCIGVVNGLAWTSVGGELLQVECAKVPGKGNVKLTGQLGDVMKESAEAALTWVRANSRMLGLADDFCKDIDLHIHLPEGAVPKDGPSAGVTMTTALVSVLTGIPVHQAVAMTGEVTLRGRVLPIGGLKEKTLAAYRAGITTLVIPKENTKDLEEIPADVLAKFTVVPVCEVGEVLKVALLHLPEPRKEACDGDQVG